MMKKLLGVLLVLCLVVGLAPVSALAADGEKAIQLGTTAIEDPEKVIILNENNPEENTKTYYTPNSYIYFGNDNGAPILWRVLDAQKANDESTDGMFLLSEYLLGSNVQFDKDGSANKDQTNPNAWQKSDAQAWCTTSYGNFFTAGEKQGIVGVTKEETDASNRYQIPWNPSALNGKQTGEDQNKDKLFFLSAQELYDYVGNYDGAPGLKAYTDSTETSAGMWWLRSPSADYDSISGVVLDDGMVLNYNVLRALAARPAFNINLNSVLFTSAAEGGKISAAPGGGSGGEAAGSISKISSTTTNEWKFTLKDNTRASFNAKLSGSSTVTPGESISIEYSGATTGHNEYVSAILTDASGNALYYGRLVNTSDAASGTVSMAIPADLAAGSYTLKVFSEQYNGDKKTDYASDFIDINLTVLYVITYNPGANGTGEETTATKTAGEALTLKGAIFTRTGHRQTGWATTDGGEKVYDLGGSYATDAAVELYPVWEAETYTITYVLNGGTINGEYPTTYTYGVGATLPTDVTREGYTFKGWSSDAEGTIPTGSIGTGASGNKTYYAQWQKNAATVYTVTVSNDGNGTGTAVPSSGVTGTEVTLTATANSGYRFKEWQVITGGVTVTDNKLIIGTANVEVKAIFELIPTVTYTVTFDPNSGSGMMAPQTFTEGVAQNLTLNTFIREGFTFIGWNTAADGSGTSFADGASVTASSNATLYAQWQKNAATIYTVTVSNDGNGTGTAVPSSGVTGTEVTLTATPNSGYRFKEWQVVTGGVTVTDNKLMIGTANVEVKAIFELIPAATYTITFDPNGGSGMMAPQTFTEGVAQNLTLNAFIREGFTFIGWNTMADGSGNSFVDGASVTASSNATLYAQWKAVPVVTPLTITKQPTDQFVVEGQRAEFSVEAAGDGLTYQWYINRNDGRGWRELDGAIGTAYVTSVTDLECDGFQYGCLITDQYGNILKSDVAVLHVSKVPVLPETGDSSTPMLWLAMSILSMAGILLLRKKAYSR